MTVDALGDSTYCELRRLAEILFDVAAGREPTRAALRAQVEIVVRLLRDSEARFTEDASEVLVDRLLSFADTWYGVAPLMASALAVILGEPLPDPPSGLPGRSGATLRDGEAVQ